MSRRTLDDMPRLSFSFDVPNSEYEQLMEIARREGVSVRSLLAWTMRAEIVERARQAIAAHRAAVAVPTTTVAA